MNNEYQNKSKIIILFMIITIILCTFFYCQRYAQGNRTRNTQRTERVIRDASNAQEKTDAFGNSLNSADALSVLIFICYILEITYIFIFPNWIFKIERKPKFRCQMARSKIPDRIRTNVR